MNFYRDAIAAYVPKNEQEPSIRHAILRFIDGSSGCVGSHQLGGTFDQFGHCR
jgi:hypothetical protein